MSIRSRVERLESLLDDLDLEGVWTDDMIRDMAREEGISEGDMFRIWDAVVEGRRLTCPDIGPLHDAIEQLKNDPAAPWKRLENERR